MLDYPTFALNVKKNRKWRNALRVEESVGDGVRGAQNTIRSPMHTLGRGNDRVDGCREE